MKAFSKFFSLLFLVSLIGLVFISCDFEDFNAESNATVKVKSVQTTSTTGGKCTVKVTVAVSNLADGETVKMVGAKVGTVKSNPTLRESRSGVKSATMSFYLHHNQKYYITPFFKTNFTDGEIEGSVKSYRTE